MTINDEFIVKLINERIDEKINNVMDDVIRTKVREQMNRKIDQELSYNSSDVRTYLCQEARKQVSELIQEYSKDDWKRIANSIANDLKYKLADEIMTSIGYYLLHRNDKDDDDEG